MKKRIAAMVLSVTMIVGAVAGCGKNESTENGSDIKVNKTGYPVTEEKLTLKVMGATDTSLPDDWNDLVLFRELEKITNVHLDFDVVASANYENQKNLAFASGDMPDFFYKGRLSTQDELTYGGSGVLIDLVPYLEYAPNLQKAFEDFPEVKPSITMDDGKIVSLPEINDVPRDRAIKMWINEAWINKLGLSMPETADEWYTVLKAFKEQDPNGNGIADEIPLSFGNMDSLYHMMSAFGLLFTIYAENDKVIYSPADERSREGIRFFSKLFKEGILDNQCFTQNDEKLAAKAGGEYALVGCFTGMSAGAAVSHEGEYALLPPLKTADGKRVWKGRNRFGKGTFAITNKNKYPEATMRVIDYLYGEEGGILARLGVENETYRVLEDGTWEYIIPDDFDKSLNFENTIGTVSGAYSPMRQPTEMILKAHHEEGAMTLDKRMEALTPYLVVPYPSVYFSTEEQKKVNSYNTDLSSCVSQFFARAITGEIDVDEEWDSYIADLKRIGLDDLLSIYQKKYDEYMQKY